MHTVIVIVAGLIVLGLFFGVAHLLSNGDEKRVAVACRAFIPVWLIVSLVNMYIGVAVAGYSVVAELVVLVFVFGIPVGAAWLLGARPGGEPAP